MDALQDVVIGALVASVFGALGYLLRGVFEERKERRRQEQATKAAQEKQRADAIAQLRRFKALLDESFGIFTTQNKQRNRLMQQLIMHHGDRVQRGLGYDETFFRLYEDMDEQERDLFDVVRGMTHYSMVGANQRMLDWLNDHVSASELIGETSPEIAALDESLRDLRLHLSAWFAKYHAVVENDTRRSLVYLDDEKRHGVKFPKEIHTRLDRVLESLRKDQAS